MFKQHFNCGGIRGQRDKEKGEREILHGGVRLITVIIQSNVKTKR